MSYLLSDRSVLALRSSLELPVERIGKVLDVQNCHGGLLLNSSIMEELSTTCQGSQGFRFWQGPRSPEALSDPGRTARSAWACQRNWRFHFCGWVVSYF